MRPENGQYLQVAVSDSGVYKGQRFAVCVGTGSPGPVADFVASQGLRQNVLSWRNPIECSFHGTMIRCRTDGFPVGPGDGILVIDKPAGPATLDSYTHQGLSPGTTYYYAAFAHDGLSYYAAPLFAQAMPLSPADFDRDDDVDQTDFGHLQACLAGSGVLIPPGCEDADLDQDDQVAEQDVALFLDCVGGDHSVPGC